MTTTTTTTTRTGTGTGTTSQLVLPGQAAAPDGPVDLTIMFVIHHAFRRDLRDFAAAAVATPASDRATWRALAARWTLFSTVLHHHHTGEDTGIWPAVLAKVDAAGDREARATLEAMEAEHGQIDPLLAAAAAGFDRLADADDDAARASLASCLVAAREHLAEHLLHEETEALRLVQKHLTQREWDGIEEESFASGVSPRERLRIVAWVMHRLPAVGVDRVRQQPGAAVLFPVWRFVLAPAFARRQRRAFRYVPGV